MKCKNCGTEFIEGIFCPECGTKMESPEDSNSVEVKEKVGKDNLEAAAAERKRAAKLEAQKRKQQAAIEEEQRKREQSLPFSHTIDTISSAEIHNFSLS